MMPPGFKLLSVALLALAGALLIGCAGMASAPGSGGALSEPAWQDPTLPPAATATMAAPTPVDGDTASSPDTPAAPVFTPMPTLAPARPTYTPRPAPTRLGDGERQAAPAFQAVTLDGSAVYLEDLLGTPTLLAFWAPW